MLSLNARAVSITQLALFFLGGAHQDTFVSYRWHGGFSPYGEVDITITQAGGVHVDWQKRKQEMKDYDTDLSAQELETMRTLVRSTDFFSQPQKDSQFATDVGQTELTISQDGQSRTLVFNYRPALDPLCEFLRKLQTQALAAQALAEGDAYSTLGALAPNYAGTKALQPQRLKDPLLKYLQSVTDRQKYQWGLEALTVVTTPAEFAGFISSKSRGESKMPLAVDLGNFPKEYSLALCPVYLAFLKENYSDYSKFEGDGNNQAEAMVYALGELRYKPAIEFFMRWFQQNTKLASGGLMPLAHMGSAAIPPLANELDGANEIHRQCAMDLLKIASAGNPHSGYSNPFTEFEYADMKILFTKLVFPKLSRLATDDPSESIRDKATATLQSITSEMNKSAKIEPPKP